MMDQLSSVGVQFIPGVLDVLVQQNIDYYKRLETERAENPCFRGIMKRRDWAISPIYKLNRPIRPWSLHMISGKERKLLGRARRTPGLYKRINPKTGRLTTALLADTNERIHSSVRARLACRGLSAKDRKVWKCKPLTRAWRLRQVPVQFQDPIPRDAPWGPQNGMEAEAGPSEETGHVLGSSELRWVWEYVGSEQVAPTVRTLVEENMGPFETHLLNISVGKNRQVLHRAEVEDFSRFER
jgi:hypothetical protein